MWTIFLLPLRPEPTEWWSWPATRIIASHNRETPLPSGGWRMLEEIGLEKERVHFATVASNMPAEFVRITNEVEDTLKRLGPSRLKKQAAA